MDKKIIKLKYPTIERFVRDYSQISKGSLFIPTKAPLENGTPLTLKITLPEIKPIFAFNGIVSKIPHEVQGEKSGMFISFSDGYDETALQLDAVLRVHPEYNEKLFLQTSDTEGSTLGIQPGFPGGHPDDQNENKLERLGASLEDFPNIAQEQNEDFPREQSDGTTSDLSDDAQNVLTELESTLKDSQLFDQKILEEISSNDSAEILQDEGLTFEWVRVAVDSKEYDSIDEEIVLPPPPRRDAKKDLSPIERLRVKPSGEFTMNLTKAMLRSGYYDSDHPGSKTAKQGLYDEFLKSLGESNEIMVSKEETNEKLDFTITGILDEPVNIRTVVGAGMAKLFVPKLANYFNRKDLISFAIKKTITSEHFDSFINIMSDPKAEHSENLQVGELLTEALVSHGITEISAVFKDDMIALTENLPWRVEMAIQRLAKDLKVMPMFEAEAEEDIKDMKVRIIEDIIRPLRHPLFLKDMVVSSYIIAKNVENLESEDLEETIISCFPDNMLLPTSHFIIEEMDKLQENKETVMANQALAERYTGVKRILKLIASRVVSEKIPGSQKFLEQLYFSEILIFKELPPEVQYRVNTVKMATDLQINIRKYIKKILTVKGENEALILLKAFKRSSPVLIERNAWKVINTLAKALDKAKKDSADFSRCCEPLTPLQFVLQDRSDDIITTYVNGDETQQPEVSNIIKLFGAEGIEMLSKILSEAEDDVVRNMAIDALSSQGERARNWALSLLSEREKDWHYYKNALVVLGHVGHEDEDLILTRKYLRNAQPELREEALTTMLNLDARDSEALILAAMNDKEAIVQQRAVASLHNVAPLSSSSARKVLGIITELEPDDKEESLNHARKIARIIKVLGTLPAPPKPKEIEETVLIITKEIVGQEKNLLKIFKKSSEEGHAIILSAAFETLGRIGGPQSVSFLQKVTKGEVPHLELALSAIKSIKSRISENSSQQ